MTAPRIPGLLGNYRPRPVEAVFWVIALAVPFLFSDDLAFATTVITTVLFALSLDIILGFAGVITLGHALFFGVGAYAAGVVATAGWTEPVTGALIGGAAAAVVGAMLGPLILRFTGLTLIMLTLAMNGVAYELANQATWLTGGDDGLQGISLSPLFGVFHWSVLEPTKYLYALGWVFVLFILIRCLSNSPFGIALRGIRENKERMVLVGAPVLRHLIRAYVISAFIAGIAGALTTQATEFVGLDVLSIDTSVGILVMLVMGGIGRLYGGLVGVPVYLIVRHLAATWNPYHWLFVVGALLVIVVRFSQGGLLGTCDLAFQRVRGALTRS